METQIIDSTMTKDRRLRQLVRRYFKPADFFTDRGHNPAKPVCSDMRLAVIQDGFRSPVCNKGIQYVLKPGRLDPAGELAIGKSAGAALTELHVGFGVQLSGFRHPQYAPGTFFHRLSAFNQYRICTGARQCQRRKQTGRACTDNKRRAGQGCPGQLYGRRSGNI